MMPWTRGLTRHAVTLVLLATATVTVAEEPPQTGAELLAEGYTARAIAQLEQALGRNPFDPVVLNNLAAAYNEQGEYPRAQTLLRRAQRLSPGDPTIQANLDAIEDWMNHLAERSEALQRTRSNMATQGDGEPIRVPPEPPPLWPQR